MIKFAAAALVAAIAATPAAAQDAPATFTGGHIEVVTGFDAARIEQETGKGLIYGLAGGFDFQNGAVVFGVEGEASESTNKRCETDGEDELCLRAGRDLYAGGRVGAVVGGRTLVYVKGGYTNWRVSASDGDETVSAKLDGLRAGIGAEATVGQILVKLEYRYSNYEEGVTRHQGVVGFGVRF